jgi:mono/diheme cytochrome c family protein
MGMRRAWVGWGLVGAMSILCGSASVFAGQAGAKGDAAKLVNPVAPGEASAAAGGAIFKRRCSACHGADAKGGPPKEDFTKPASNLVDDQWDHGSSDGEIFSVIKNGVPPDFLMEPWDDRLSDTDIWNIVNFLRAEAKKGK